MSGGSYDYLCYALDRGELPDAGSGIVDTLKQMRRRLGELDRERWKAGREDHSNAFGVAGERTQLVLSALDSAAEWSRALSEAWRIVEWLDSRDMDVDQAGDEMREWAHATRLLPDRPAVYQLVVDSTHGQRTYMLQPIAPNNGTELLTRITLQLYDGTPLLRFPFAMTEDGMYIRHEPD